MPHPERDPATGDVHEVATPQEARQGQFGLRVLYVLIGALTLAFVAWVVVGFIG